MSKMHSRARGKSGSNKPLQKTQPTWVPLKPKELELLIVKLAKDGNAPSRIGLLLRDSYGVPDARIVIGKRIGELLKEKNLTAKVPEDVNFLIRKSVLLRKHMEMNKQDEAAKRGLLLIESKIKRLVKYYKRTKRLPVSWKYDPAKVSLTTD